MKDGISPAALQRALVMQKQPEYDADGYCLHVRAHYVNLGPVGRDACPDCGNIKWGAEWLKPLKPDRAPAAAPRTE